MNNVAIICADAMVMVPLYQC